MPLIETQLLEELLEVIGKKLDKNTFFNFYFFLVDSFFFFKFILLFNLNKI
jgi:hypothetical protein